MNNDLDFNDDFQRAYGLMENGCRHVLITGKAGSGKSTLLRHFKEHTGKNVVVLAPTGVAALNAGGQTIHKFFGFPPKLVRKDEIHKGRNRGVIKKLDAVVIDEISMLRADVLDAIDYALRINRENMDEAFGGCQLIGFGDLFQLPPVVNALEREVFGQMYPTPFFFSAAVMEGLSFDLLELNTVYRQSDSRFLGLLNRIRYNEVTEDDLELLNRRVVKSSEEISDCIMLTATNAKANAVNIVRLSKIDAPVFDYEAMVLGEFEESLFPTDYHLRLKVGAQVMMIKNGPDWFNGSIGEVTGLTEDSIVVEINGKACTVTRETWTRIKYSLNSETGKIEEEEIGHFEQYPIRLGWAITIHKSQGQTFDKIVIDLARGAFAHGQLYVALSRCRSLEGIRLCTPIVYRDIIFDERINSFMNRDHGNISA